MVASHVSIGTAAPFVRFFRVFDGRQIGARLLSFFLSRGKRLSFFLFPIGDDRLFVLLRTLFFSFWLESLQAARTLTCLISDYNLFSPPLV